MTWFDGAGVVVAITVAGSSGADGRKHGHASVSYTTRCDNLEQQ